MNNLLRQSILTLTASSLWASAAAADLQPGYEKGHGQLGDKMFVDEAFPGSGDSFTDAYVWWAAEMNNLWDPGDSITITGIAIPIRSDTASPNNITFTFYDLGDDNAYNSGDEMVGKVTVAYPGGESGVWFAKFDEPLTFVSKSAGIALCIDGAKGPMRLKVLKNGSKTGIVRKMRKNGEALESEYPYFAMSLAGVAVKAKKGAK